MKNIKRYSIYFIVCLVSLFVCSSKVSAMQKVMYYFDYETQDFTNSYSSTLFEKLEDLKDHIETYNVHDRSYVISINHSKIYIGLLLARTNKESSYCSDYFLLSYKPVYSSGWYYLESFISPGYCDMSNRSWSISTVEVSLSDFLSDNTSSFYSSLDNYLNRGYSSNSNNLYIYKSLSERESWFSSRNYNIDIYTQNFGVIYYSNIPLYFQDKVSSNSANNLSVQDVCSTTNSKYYDSMFIYNDITTSKTLSCGDDFKTYFEYLEQNSDPITVNLTTYQTEDSNNHEYNSWAKMNIVVDDDYLENETVCSFQDTFNNTTNFSVESEYDYYAYSNGTLSCNIKDGNEIIEEYTYTLSILSDINVVDTYSTTINDNTLYSVNVEYSYGYTLKPDYIPFKIEYFSQESTTLTQFINSVKFYYQNGNSQRIETSLINLKDYKCNKTNSNYIVCNGYIDNSNAKFDHFEINFILNTFNEETNISYYDNLPFNWSNRNVDFLITDFIGYKRYNLDKNRNRVYIYKSEDNVSDSGNIYFPYTLNHSNTIDLIAFYYNADGTFEATLPSMSYNDYYEYYSVDFNNTSGVLVLTFDNSMFTSFNNNFMEQYGYIYIPDYWYIQMHGDTQLGVVLTDNDGNKIVISNDYNNTLINKTYNIDSLFGGVKNYLNSIKKYTTMFTDEISYFWGKLNSEQQTFFVSMFMLIVITSIIVLARRH